MTRSTDRIRDLDPDGPADASPFVPAAHELGGIAVALPRVGAALYWERSTQAVAGEGPPAALRPRVAVLLGATAVRSVLGPGHRIAELADGSVVAPDGTPVVATLHPSAVLRTDAPDARERAFEQLVDALRRAAAIAEAR